MELCRKDHKGWYIVNKCYKRWQGPAVRLKMMGYDMKRYVGSPSSLYQFDLVIASFIFSDNGDMDHQMMGVECLCGKNNYN